jgi:hypothetical protein
MVREDLRLNCKKALVPEEVEDDPVSGPRKVPAHYKSCRSARSEFGDLCGKEGKWWQPKNKKDLFIYLKRI